MARPMPRAPPVTTAILPWSFMSQSLSICIEPVDARRIGSERDPATLSQSELADDPRRQGPGLAAIHIQESVAPEMLGDSDRALPSVAFWQNLDMLWPDPDGGRAVLLG